MPERERFLELCARQDRVPEGQLGGPLLDRDARKQPVVVGLGVVPTARVQRDFFLDLPGALEFITSPRGIARLIERHLAEPEQHDAQVGARHVVLGLIVRDPSNPVITLLVFPPRQIELTELSEQVPQSLMKSGLRERADPLALDSLGEGNHLFLEDGQEVIAQAEPFGFGPCRVVLGPEPAHRMLDQADHLGDGILGDHLGGAFLVSGRALRSRWLARRSAAPSRRGRARPGAGPGLLGIMLGECGVLMALAALARAVRSWSRARRYRKVEVAAQLTTDTATSPPKAATRGLRRHQRHSRSARLTGRARIASPERNRRRSSPRAAAVA